MRLDFHSQPEVPVGGTTTVFTSSKIPGTGVVAYCVALRGANVTTAVITRIRLKANGQTLWDISYAQLRAYLIRLSRGNLDPGAAATEFVIPLYLPDEKGDARFESQFPVGASAQLELTFAAFAPDAGVDAVEVGWIGEPGVTAVVFPKFLGIPMDITAGQVNANFIIRQAGKIRGLTINFLGLTRIRMLISGDQVIHGTGVLFRVHQRLEEGTAGIDTIFRKIAPAKEILVRENTTVGESKLELDTEAGVWVGDTNELGLLSLSPQGAQG